ncbi:DUF2730 domain-containing protein [Sapientia aquatica]|uniref:DUF2730 domain-containing protein n=2 Tax=Sapientia aquatica TaxID=1549640 RepID=A0A4R5W203_9BURK|nr:DUF2730 domain-containing protein [Sapientia aquatica]
MQTGVMLVIGIYTWVIGRYSATAKEVMELQLRILSLEEKIRHLPDINVVQELAGDMKSMQSQLQALRDSITPLTRSVDRVNDYLLNHK